MNKMIIMAQSITKSFGEVKVLDGLDLQVPKCIAGFVGENGAGKTTTINILLGLLKPNNGKATIFGFDCWHESFEIRRKLGAMHEVNAYPSNFTAKRFLQHVARIYGVTQIEQRVEEILRQVGLHDVKSKPIKTYSAGMTRRLGLAQALIGDPEFVILDEPTANIDPLGRIALLEKIRELNREEDIGFLVSTHILSDLEKICEWISIISKGKVIDQGYVKDLETKYSANVYKIEVSNPELLLKKINELNIVEKAWIKDQKIYCRTKDQKEFNKKVLDAVVSLKLQLINLKPLQGTIEKIYKESIGVEASRDYF